jgi:hypothetical protein
VPQNCGWFHLIDQEDFDLFHLRSFLSDGGFMALLSAPTGVFILVDQDQQQAGGCCSKAAFIHSHFPKGLNLKLKSSALLISSSIGSSLESASPVACSMEERPITMPSSHRGLWDPNGRPQPSLV